MYSSDIITIDIVTKKIYNRLICSGCKNDFGGFYTSLAWDFNKIVQFYCIDCNQDVLCGKIKIGDIESG